MDSLEFYIVFHKTIFPQNIPLYPCFKYMAVNELVEKDIDINQLNHEVLYEHTIPAYNALYQMLRFNENSVILNLPSPKTQFVGFGQYDMIIDKDKFKSVIDILNKQSGVVGFFPGEMSMILDVLDISKWNEILAKYNSLHKTSHSMEELVDYPVFLLNTFIVPSWFFLRLQNDIKTLLPLIFKHLNYNMMHIGGTLERLNGLLISCAVKEKLFNAYISDSITDVRSQTILDPTRHVG